MAFEAELEAELGGVVGAVIRCIAVMPRGQVRTMMIVDCRATQEAVEHVIGLDDLECDEGHRAIRAAHVACVLLGQGLLGAATMNVAPSVVAEIDGAQQALEALLRVLATRVSTVDRVMQLMILEGESIDGALDAIERGRC